jgi:hypothetical protein
MQKIYAGISYHEPFTSLKDAEIVYVVQDQRSQQLSP